MALLGSAIYAQARGTSAQPSTRPLILTIDVMNFGGLEKFRAPKVTALAFFNVLEQLNPGWATTRDPIQNSVAVKPGLLVLPDPDQTGPNFVRFAWFRCDEKPKDPGLTAQMVDDFEALRVKHAHDGNAHGFFVVKLAPNPMDHAVWQLRTPGSLTVRSEIQFNSDSDPNGVAHSAVYKAVVAAGTAPYTNKQIR